MQSAMLVKAEDSQDVLHKAVGRMSDLGAEFADAKSQTIRTVGISSMNGELRQLVRKSTGGVCLRAWMNGRWGYGTVTSFDPAAVMRAAEDAVRNASGDGRPGMELEPSAVRRHERAHVRIHPDSVGIDEKISAVLELDSAQGVDPKVVNRMGAYSEEIKDNLLVNSAGSDLGWEEVRTLCRAMSVAADGGRMEQYYGGPDSTLGFEVVKDSDLELIGRTTAEEAVRTVRRTVSRTTSGRDDSA